MYCYSEITYFREIYFIFTFSEGLGSHQMYRADLLPQLQELVVLVVVVGPFCLHLRDNLILPGPLIFGRRDESCVGPSGGRSGNSFGGRPNGSNESDSD